MSPQPRRDTTAGRVYNDLRNLARRQDQPTDELFQLYLLKRFLFRLAQSPQNGRLVLKGGTLLAAYQLRRPTQDIDVQAQQLSGDVETIQRMVEQVCTVEVEDGVTFQLDQMGVQTIREGATYEGLRVRVPATLGPAQLVLRLDINIGDPITPGPAEVSYPQLLGGSFDVTGYPLPAVLAEKLITMVELGEGNTRDRDIGDVVRITGTHPIDAEQLRSACEATATYRQVQLEPLATLVGALGQRRQDPWARWLRRVHLEDELPGSFADALQQVIDFADPILDGTLSAATWLPQYREWASSP